MSEVGFEPTPSIEDQNTSPIYDNLKSGALDHSAILTCTIQEEIFLYFLNYYVVAMDNCNFNGILRISNKNQIWKKIRDLI